MRTEIPMVGGAYTARSSNLNAQVCQNLYLEVDNTGAKSIISLVGSPGTKPWHNTGTAGEVRKFYESRNFLYVVVGPTVYTISTGLIRTTIGTIGTSSGWVDITDDGVNVCFFDTTGGWVWDGVTFTAITDADFPANLSGAT